jgi:hypothetical protein
MRRWTMAVLAGVLVLGPLFPWGGGQDSDPPTCFGMVGWYTVPCGGWQAVATGVVAGVTVWLLLSWPNRRHASVA